MIIWMMKYNYSQIKCLKSRSPCIITKMTIENKIAYKFLHDQLASSFFFSKMEWNWTEMKKNVYGQKKLTFGLNKKCGNISGKCGVFVQKPLADHILVCEILFSISTISRNSVVIKYFQFDGTCVRFS